MAIETTPTMVQDVYRKSRERLDIIRAGWAVR